MNKRLKLFAQVMLGKHIFNILKTLKTDFYDKKGQLSHAQEGEDRVLSSLLYKLHGGRQINDGFYVDVGAHHPYRYSNTCLFYKQGWRGINIDAMPGSMSAFRKQRPRDINLESGIAREAGTRKLYLFNEPALNTFDESLASARCNDDWPIETTVDVPMVPLSEILRKYLPSGKAINFLTVDVEGFDLEVLQSNDWQKYRPTVVLVETLGLTIDDLTSDPVTAYLRSLGYVAYAKTVNTTFFTDNTFAQTEAVRHSNRLEPDITPARTKPDRQPKVSSEDGQNQILDCPGNLLHG
jgi:FkbM family methyltransferase